MAAMHLKPALGRNSLFLLAFLIFIVTNCSSADFAGTSKSKAPVKVPQSEDHQKVPEIEEKKEDIDLTVQEPVDLTPKEPEPEPVVEPPKAEIIDLTKFDDGDTLTGDIGHLVGGFYDNENYDELYIEFQKNNIVKATYNYKNGRLIGTYNSESGWVDAWWCEHDKDKKWSGEARFHFKKDGKKPFFEGMWRKGTKGDWVDDWDLNYLGPDLKDESLKNKLLSRMDSNNFNCQR